MRSMPAMIRAIISAFILVFPTLVFAIGNPKDSVVDRMIINGLAGALLVACAFIVKGIYDWYKNNNTQKSEHTNERKEEKVENIQLKPNCGNQGGPNEIDSANSNSRTDKAVSGLRTNGKTVPQTKHNISSFPLTMLFIILGGEVGRRIYRLITFSTSGQAILIAACSIVFCGILGWFVARTIVNFINAKPTAKWNKVKLAWAYGAGGLIASIIILCLTPSHPTITYPMSSKEQIATTHTRVEHPQPYQPAESIVSESKKTPLAKLFDEVQEPLDNPNYAEHYISRGDAYVKLNDNRQAIIEFNRAISIDPYRARAYVSRASAYSKLGNYQQAIMDCSKAIELDPNSSSSYGAYCARGAAYLFLKESGEAIRDFDRHLALKPANPSVDAAVYGLRGFAYEEIGDRTRAIGDFKSAARLGDENAKEILISLGKDW